MVLFLNWIGGWDLQSSKGFCFFFEVCLDASQNY